MTQPVATDALLAHARRRVAPAGHGTATIVGAGLFVALAALTANPLVTIACVVAALFAGRLLWRSAEPAILLFMVMFQWLQVAVRVIDSDVRGIPLSDVTLGSVSGIEDAIWIGLGAIVVLAIGLRVGAGPRRASAANIASEVLECSTNRVFVAYVVLAVVGLVFEKLAWQYPSLTQAILPLTVLKVVPFVVLACMVLTQRRGYRFFVIALTIELAIGLRGYFADFKPVFFALLMLAPALRLRLTYRQMAAVAITGALLIAFSLFWTVVKTDYRTMLNRGTNKQQVLVSLPDRFRFMASAFGRVGTSDLLGAIPTGVARLSAVDLLAATVSYVPRTVAHSDGQIWIGALSHVLAPRILFPNKPGLENDSRATRLYTGLAVAGGDEGTSIGIGYVAESYVDFGRWGMWFPLLALGLLWGWMYRKLLRWSSHRIVAYGIAIACFLPLAFFETAASKQLGGGVSRFVVLSLLLVLFQRRWWHLMRPVRRGQMPPPIAPPAAPPSRSLETWHV